MKFLVVLLILTLFLSGCKIDADGTVTITTAEIPEALLHCVPVPERDKPFVKITERQAALLLARYKTAHADCYEKLASVRELYYAAKNQTGKLELPGNGKEKWNAFITSLLTGS